MAGGFVGRAVLGSGSAGYLALVAGEHYVGTRGVVAPPIHLVTMITPRIRPPVRSATY